MSGLLKILGFLWGCVALGGPPEVSTASKLCAKVLGEGLGTQQPLDFKGGSEPRKGLAIPPSEEIPFEVSIDGRSLQGALKRSDVDLYYGSLKELATARAIRSGARRSPETYNPLLRNEDLMNKWLVGIRKVNDYPFDSLLDPKPYVLREVTRRPDPEHLVAFFPTEWAQGRMRNYLRPKYSASIPTNPIPPVLIPGKVRLAPRWMHLNAQEYLARAETHKMYLILGTNDHVSFGSDGLPRRVSSAENRGRNWTDRD